MPFRPTQGRPVFCRECFQQRKFAGAGGIWTDPCSFRDRLKGHVAAWPFLCRARSDARTLRASQQSSQRDSMLLASLADPSCLSRRAPSRRCILAVSAGCRGGAPARRARRRRRRTAVRSSRSRPSPIEDASEFIATLRSLRSTTVQPEVEGLDHADLRQVRRPRAASARRSCRSTPDSSRPRCRARKPTAPALEADVEYWRQQVKRLESLVEAGAISQAGIRSGAELAADRRGAARRARRAGARGPRGARSSTA